MSEPVVQLKLTLALARRAAANHPKPTIVQNIDGCLDSPHGPFRIRSLPKHKNMSIPLEVGAG